MQVVVLCLDFSMLMINNPLHLDYREHLGQDGKQPSLENMK